MSIHEHRLYICIVSSYKCYTEVSLVIKHCVCVLYIVSKAPAQPVRQSKYESFQVYAATHKTDEQKKEEVDNIQIF